MNLKPILITAFCLPATLAWATVFTSNTTIAVGDATYDGQPIVVSNCTLTVNGPHSFASLALTNAAVLTHSPAPNGETNNCLDLTIANDAVVDATSRIDASGGGYGTGGGYSKTGNIIPVDYQMTSALATDPPGAYVLTLTYTLAAQ